METYLESQRSYMRNQSLGCPFLFEGNGNTLFTLLRSFTLSGPCDVRSRLKGMETASDSPRTHTTKFLLCSAFPFEGNGNDNESTLQITADETYDARSRLKGMETDTSCSQSLALFPFCSAFPFEGNGNLFTPRSKRVCSFLPYDVRSRLKGMET